MALWVHPLYVLIRGRNILIKNKIAYSRSRKQILESLILQSNKQCYKIKN